MSSLPTCCGNLYCLLKDKCYFRYLKIIFILEYKSNFNYFQKINIKFKSNHPEIIKVNNEGEIFAVRPGNAIITASGLDGKNAHIKILAISNNGFISNYTLNNHNASQYKKLMIVAHPDDETLWGGGKLFKDRYFVVCLTNGYHSRRANEFKKLSTH